jgi:hypothetical protein
MIAPDRIAGVSRSIFSVARHFGGCRAFGCEYVYDPRTDELVRSDLLKNPKRKKRTAESSGDLFDKAAAQ